MNDLAILEIAFSNITFSESQVAKILHIGKPKVKELLGDKIRAERTGKGHNKVRCNAYDVIKHLIG